MNVAEVASRLAGIAQQKQKMGQWKQQLKGVETVVRQLETIRQQWRDQVTWSDGMTIPLGELHQLHDRLEEQERLWHTSRQRDLPEVELGRLQAKIEQVEARFRALTTQEKQLRQLEDLWERWQSVAAKKECAGRLKEAQEKWEVEQRQEAALLTAYDELQQIKEHLQEQKNIRATIEDVLQELDSAIAGNQKEKWREMVFTNINALSQEIGARLHKVEELTVYGQREADELQKQVEKADATLEPDRQRIHDKQQKSMAYQKNFAELAQELYKWAHERERLKLPVADGESATDLQELLQLLQAEQHHLQWFATNVAIL